MEIFGFLTRYFILSSESIDEINSFLVLEAEILKRARNALNVVISQKKKDCCFFNKSQDG